jgi:hypothetical protein
LGEKRAQGTPTNKQTNKQTDEQAPRLVHINLNERFVSGPALPPIFLPDATHEHFHFQRKNFGWKTAFQFLEPRADGRREEELDR